MVEQTVEEKKFDSTEFETMRVNCIRFLPSIVAEKSATKNIWDGQTEVKQYTLSPVEWGYNKRQTGVRNRVKHHDRCKIVKSETPSVKI